MKTRCLVGERSSVSAADVDRRDTAAARSRSRVRRLPVRDLDVVRVGEVVHDVDRLARARLAACVLRRAPARLRSTPPHASSTAATAIVRRIASSSPRPRVLPAGPTPSTRSSATRSPAAASSARLERPAQQRAHHQPHQSHQGEPASIPSTHTAMNRLGADRPHSPPAERRLQHQPSAHSASQTSRPRTSGPHRRPTSATPTSVAMRQRRRAYRRRASVIRLAACRFSVRISDHIVPPNPRNAAEHREQPRCRAAGRATDPARHEDQEADRQLDPEPGVPHRRGTLLRWPVLGLHEPDKPIRL